MRKNLTEGLFEDVITREIFLKKTPQGKEKTTNFLYSFQWESVILKDINVLPDGEW